MHYIIQNAIRFDPADYTLEQTHEPHTVVTLTVTMSRLLLFLVEKHGENVTKDDILSQVWEAHGLRASTNSLNKYISDLRQMFRALGLEDEIIATIPRVGFSISGAIVISTVSRMESEIVPIVSATPLEERRDGLRTYQYVFLFIVVLFLSGLLFYIFHPKDSDEDIYTTTQKSYPVGMIDTCPVVSLKPVADNLKARSIEITKHILAMRGRSCGNEIQYYIYFSEDVIYHQRGRVFLADCAMKDPKMGLITSCINFYGADYDTND
ncbi:winged helix-turn-helix domain-containing protein [uncultured Cedecea sp.]|uniref:winged helix-turn-helix domain-containing protein n=1 Tax=uncultured Cedecea sp. TaxID=988762 RepID=UPI00261CB6DC|nr:winged helix-turn-helix domain-containing protein [uncultured Cedecea sp.]